MRHDGVLHEIIEGRMRGKPTRQRKRNQILHDLAMVKAMLHSKEQPRTDYRGMEMQRKDVSNLLLLCSRRWLMMMTDRHLDRI